MNIENVKQLLSRLNQGERLDADTLQRLTEGGYIRSSDVTHNQTPKGVRELLFISITEKGRNVLANS
jgi:hypothetical protein